MGVRVVDEGSILEEALKLASGAESGLDVASPWIRGASLRRLLAARPAAVRTRILFRAKEPEDLDITDLAALLTAVRRGAEVRYSQHLHAKVIVADGERAIVSSSNLTEAAGYGSYEIERRNRELGVVVEDDPEALRGIAERFEAVWAEGEWLDDAVVGVVMDFPTDGSFHVACWRVPSPGSYVAAHDTEGRMVVGRVTKLTGYNRSFPRMTAGMWATQGYAVTPDAGGRSYDYVDLQSLFSVPEKEQGVLGAIAATDPHSLFHVAAVEVLAGISDGRAEPPHGVPAPGTLARRAGADDLGPLLGAGEVSMGSVWHHPEIAVRASVAEILTRHLAVLGMTGSGKSNAVLVLIRELLTLDPELRVLLADTHGEYHGVAESCGGRVVGARLRLDVLADGTVKALLRLAREDPSLMALVREAADDTAWPEGFATELERLADGESETRAHHARRLAALAREGPDELCCGGPTVSFEEQWGPGLNVLDLGGVEGLEARSRVLAAALEDAYGSAVGGSGRWLVVIDEAQNYVPEQHTGLVRRVKPSLDAAFRIASEGRKFGVGLIVASQRPARVHKDVLSQCNSHLVFRLANVEDLQAVAGCFESAGRRMLDDLPGLPVGVGLAGGTAFGMPVRVEVPLADTNPHSVQTMSTRMMSG